MRAAVRMRTAVWPLCRSLAKERDVLSSPAVPLLFDRPFDTARPEVEGTWWGRLALTLGGYYGKESKRRRGANNLYDAIVEQAESSKFYTAMELEKTAFAAVYHVLGLHMWLLIKRLGTEKESKKLVQIVYDQFLHDVEIRVHRAGVRVKVSQKLEDLERKFYGRCLAYDKATSPDAEETLALALLRNVYDEDKAKDAASHRLERYLKREIECLRLTDDTAVQQGRIRFTRL